MTHDGTMFEWDYTATDIKEYNSLILDDYTDVPGQTPKKEEDDQIFLETPLLVLCQEFFDANCGCDTECVIQYMAPFLSSSSPDFKEATKKEAA